MPRVCDIKAREELGPARRVRGCDKGRGAPPVTVERPFSSLPPSGLSALGPGKTQKSKPNRWLEGGWGSPSRRAEAAGQRGAHRLPHAPRVLCSASLPLSTRGPRPLHSVRRPHSKLLRRPAGPCVCRHVRLCDRVTAATRPFWVHGLPGRTLSRAAIPSPRGPSLCLLHYGGGLCLEFPGSQGQAIPPPDPGPPPPLSGGRSGWLVPPGAGWAQVDNPPATGDDPDTTAVPPSLGRTLKVARCWRTV